MLRQIRHSAQRDPNRIQHILAMLRDSMQSWVRLKTRRVLVGRPMVGIGMIEHIGDIVSAQPIAKKVRSLYPDADIVWVVNKKYRDLLVNDRDINHIRTVKCLTEYMMLWRSGVFDHVVDLHINGRMCLKCCIPLTKSGPGEELNLENYYLNGRSLLEVAAISGGLEVMDESPHLEQSEPASLMVDSLLLPQNFVVIHRFSNEKERNWSEGGWDEIIKWLTQKALIAVVEVGEEPKIYIAGPGNAASLPKMKVSETAEIFRRAMFFIGIDSGPAHIANAVSCPGVIIMGSYRNFDSYNPFSGDYRNGGATIVRASDGPARNVEPSAVLKAITAYCDQPRK